MRTFTFERPTTLAGAVDLLEAFGPAARPLAGGTDLIIRLRDGTLRPTTVIDLKQIPELRPSIRREAGRLVISSTTVMTDIAADEHVRDQFVALAEAAAVVGAVQIRNRATLGGNICNASPAADTATPLLAYQATVVAVGRQGVRRIPVADFFVRSGETALAPGELVMSIELPISDRRTGAVHLRRSRRRGHDLASVTVACLVDERGVTRIAYGSVGPRPILAVDETGVLADPATSDAARALVLEEMFAAASPSPRSMRSSPEYRLAMLRLLGRRALGIAIERLNAR